MSSYYFALLTNNRFNLNAKFVLNRKSFHHQVYYSFQCHHDIISKLLLKIRLASKTRMLCLCCCISWKVEVRHRAVRFNVLMLLLVLFILQVNYQLSLDCKAISVVFQSQSRFPVKRTTVASSFYRPTRVNKSIHSIFSRQYNGVCVKRVA